jgi:Family of unknown function (DUF6188)
MSQFIYPSPISYENVDFSWILGREVTEVFFLPPTLWRFFLGSAEHLTVECSWRIIKIGHVVLCAGDHGQKFGLPAPVDAAQEATRLLSGNTIAAVELRKATADILIDLTDDLRLEIIPDSSGYESWQVYGPAGVCFVAQGGGQICTWTQ